MACFGFGGIFKMAANSQTLMADNLSLNYKYSTFSVDHIKEIKAWFDKLIKENKISDHETYRSYIEFEYNLPEEMPEAKSVVVVSLPQKVVSITFHTPPGAIKEEKFVDKCIRCGQCIQSCPTNFIQPSLTKAGFEGLWTPIADCEKSYCKFDCNKCTTVCPTGAIEELSVKEKQEFKIGTAIIDKNRCFTYADGFNCTVCYDNCPTKEKAIQFKEVKMWNYKGRQVNVKQIYVLPDACIGCAICQQVCPREDDPGIIMTPDGETREQEVLF